MVIKIQNVENEIERGLYKMRNMTFTLILALVLLSISSGLPCEAVAGITWDGQFNQFRFDVEDNGGFFQYEPTEYINTNAFDTEECGYFPTQGQIDDYQCVANGDLTQFNPVPDDIPGEIQLNAMAKGPDGGVSPPNGLKVQGYLETIPSGLNSNHAIDMAQTVIAWVSREFSVDQEGEYLLSSKLKGLVQFDAYDNGPFDYADYTVIGSITLEEIIDDNVFQLSGFPLFVSETNPSIAKSILLRTQTSGGQAVSYRLKIKLDLQSEIVNFNLVNQTVSQTIAGTFELGSESAPFTLEAKIRPKGTAGVANWMNLLLTN